MPQKLSARKDVPVNETWDLSLIYPSDSGMEADLKKARVLADEMVRDFEGKLKTSEDVSKVLKLYEELIKAVTLVSNYSELAVSVDYTDEKNQDRYGYVESFTSKIFTDISFLENEILSLDEDIIRGAAKINPACAHYLEDLLRSKPHMLSADAEKALTAYSPVLGAPYSIYENMKMADISFDDFTVNGKSYPLGYSLFEDHYEYEPDTEIRRSAFEAFSKEIAKYQNSTATVYNAKVRYDKITSELRKYDSLFDYLLFNHKVDKALYDRQIDLIMEKLAPHMRKYAALIKKIHHLDKMTYADLKLPIDPGYAPKVTIAEAQEYIEKGLAVLGPDYVKMVKEAFRDRWIDFAQNVGKSTGGFCASPYGRNSFILLSWHGQMSDVFTLAHELGHAGHFKACNSAQSVFDTDVSLYFVECPSTTNELIMANYLKNTNDDPRFKRWVLSNIVSNTYYHNFVTHLLEAAYQREVYKLIDEGKTVQAPVLNKLFKETLEKFWGDAVEIIPGAELTWMRQPHYYSGLYSYTYSAGLTIGTQVARRIENEKETAVKDWMKVLSAGSTLDPVGLAKLAGVDITTDKPLLDTIDYIGSLIDEICELTEKIGD
ncbi:MAG: oligoendopeptidase F [Acetatifactor sp.]|nr:oligoendopeptidase F [Acetatifactor sp.]